MKQKLIFIIFIIFSCEIFSQAQTVSQSKINVPNLTTKQWREDLSFIVKMIKNVHPNPFGRVSRERFESELSQLNIAIPKLSREKIVVRMMQIVALLEDGHTNLKPYDPNGFNHWFPIRFYWFEDGIFVTAAAAEYKDLIGKQVLRIGNFSAVEAAKKGASVKGADNEFGQKEGIQYLANAVVTRALGVTNDANNLPISYKNNDGNTKEISVRAVQTAEYTSNNWMYHGEMYAPKGTETITAFLDLPAKDYRLGRSDLPLHLRERLPYWYALLDDKKTVYMQFNFVENYEETTFIGCYQKLFKEIDKIKPTKFILDIRYNSGGDGSLLLPFVHEIIKRDDLNQSGKLFTIIGRKTFSAGLMLASLMGEHTKSIFVGEPMGAAFNHYGDAGEISLPNSKLSLQVSRLFHQLSSSDDRSRYVSVEVPAVFDSKKYFDGRDVALEAIKNYSELKSIPNLFLTNKDSQTALAEYSRRKNLYGNVTWWRPFSEFEMNKAGYVLLGAKRNDDSITAFELNAKHYPQSWNAWDSLAEAYMTANNYPKAIEFYQKSLALNPLNGNATEMISKMQKGK